MGTVRPCPRCGEPRTVRRTQAAWQGQHLAYWSDCACVRAAVAAGDALSQQAVQRQRGSQDPLGAGAYDAELLARQGHLTFATFRPELLHVAPGEEHPCDLVRDWLGAILAADDPDYHAGPPPALYLRGLRGRGKTHMAIACALAAQAAGRRVALLNEAQYLHQLVSVPFGPALDALVRVPGERAWLTVFDDLGKRVPVGEAAAARTQAAWYTVIDARYNRRRWSVFTSERSLDELAAQGTIDQALYSRLYQMTRGQEIEVRGDDQRLRH